MAIDWDQPDFAFLRDQFELGRVSLFAGAGFSLGAKNLLSEAPPLGFQLAELLAKRAGIPYNNDSLPNVWEAVEPTIGTNDLWRYLSELYTIKAFADWYRIASSMTWHRIYTTNIDTLFQKLAPLGSGQRLRTIVRGEPPYERDALFDELQCVHLHGHVEHRVNGLTFTPSDFARHTARPDPWYQAVADDIQMRPFVFVGTTLEEPILTHYLELREQRDTSKKEWRPKSYLVSPHISEVKAKALANRNIVAVSATAQEFFESIEGLGILPRLKLKSVQKKVYPYLYQGDKALGRSVTEHFDLIVPEALPEPVGTRHRSRFFLGAEPTWTDIKDGWDGERCVTQELLEKLTAPRDGFHCIAFVGPAGSGKTTSVMRAVHQLAEQGKAVYFAHATNRLDLRGVLDLLAKEKDATERAYVVIDVVSHHQGSIMQSHEQLKASARLTLLIIDRTNRYATKCQRMAAELNPEVLTMPDLSESDVTSILERLTKFGFIGVLRDKPCTEQVRLFMERASRQLLVAMREATSGKDFDLILQGEFEELEPAAKLAYTICCIAVSHGAPGVYTKHLSPCLPVSSFTKGFVISELLRGVLVPGGTAGNLVRPRHTLIARWVAHDIAPLPMRLEATRTFLMQLSSSITPNQIRSRSPAYLAYRGMINSSGLKELLNAQSNDILQLYEDLKPCYGGDFLFWLQYGMAHIDANNLDLAENYLNQSLALNPKSYQTLNHLGILYLLQATTSPNPAAAQSTAQQGMELLSEEYRHRGDFDTTPYLSYMTHVTRWYLHAGRLITDEEWDALVNVSKEARKKHRMDDAIRTAADGVDFGYLRRVIKADMIDTKNADE